MSDEIGRSCVGVPTVVHRFGSIFMRYVVMLEEL